MSSIRCKYCGLSNFTDALACKRCGNPLRQIEKKKPPVRFSFYSLLTFAVVGLIVYYAIGGFESTMDKVNADEKHQQDLRRAQNPNNLSRSENDRQRTNSFVGVVSNSNSMKEAQRHNAELDQAINDAK